MAKTKTRADIARALQKKAGLTRLEAMESLDAVLRHITKGIKKSEEVKIPLFGVFFMHHKKERIGRNPKTLKPAVISARKTVGFRVSRLMKDQLNP